MICNKAYVRLHTLRKNGDTTIVLLPMSGWCVLGKEIIDDNDDDGGTNDTDAIRLSIVRGRFFTDQINSNFSENDITEMLTALQTTSTNGNIITVTFWDIFYRVACLCDDENDSFRLLWCCADHLDGPCQIVKIQLNNDKNLSLKYFCSMVVSSLNSVAPNIASISLKSYSPSFSTTVISKNEEQMSAMSSIRLEKSSKAFLNISPLSRGLLDAHNGKAASAASKHSFASSTVPFATFVITSSVAGFSTSKVPPSDAGCHLPLIYNLFFNWFITIPI